MRKLATVRKIDAINPIPNADAIEVATVGGWKVVVKKNEFNVGDMAVYCEIDSWMPTEIAPFLSKGKEPNEFEGVKGERLRTVKLRGQLSQGMLLNMSIVEKIIGNPMRKFQEGEDVTESLGIVKWEMPIPTQLAGLVKGNFPTSIPKTDQERVQNLVEEIKNAHAKGMKFEVTEKLEGSSMTCYLIDNEFGVCSRNLDMKRDPNNTLWATAIHEKLEEKMRAVPTVSDFAIQGELVGPGIQGNIYKLKKHAFYVFDIYNISLGRHLTPIERQELVRLVDLPHVPVIAVDKELGTGEVDYILDWADGKSAIGDMNSLWREGIVFKAMNGEYSFKAISNKYLMEEK